MLLRASSKAIGAGAELDAAVGRGDSGVECGDLMSRFAEAATRGNDDLEALRRELFETLGGERFVEVAATVGIFNGLVRVADAIGIPLDDGTLRASVAFRSELGLDQFAGADNSDLATASDSAAELEQKISKLFA